MKILLLSIAVALLAATACHDAPTAPAKEPAVGCTLYADIPVAGGFVRVGGRYSECPAPRYVDHWTSTTGDVFRVVWNR